jgi:hypothetical protein
MNTMCVYITSLRSRIHTEYTSGGIISKETNIETCGSKLRYYYCNQFEQKIPLNPFMITEKKQGFCSQIIFRRFKIRTKLNPLVTVSHTSLKLCASITYCICGTKITSKIFFTKLFLLNCNSSISVSNFHCHTF